ncbi:hypothetical protein PENTCL1PPCAC_27715, partial [Pristionchus entomophagus]
FFLRYRYVILCVGVLCLTAICCNYSIINFTFICMTEDANDVVDNGNGTTRQRYAYSPTEKSAILWAVAAGTIVGTFPINWAYVRWGARYPFFLSGLLSAVATAVSPWAAHAHLYLFILVRFLQGIAYAADFAAIGIIVVRWAPLTQTAIFISFLTCFSPIAQIVTNPLAGAFCTSSFGWRWAFYFHAIVTLLFFLLWVVIYKDDPQYHRSVSAKELGVIHEGKTKEHIERDSFVPYWEICKNKTILVVWFNALTELIGYIIMLSYAPTYINKVLGYSIQETALLATIGSAIHFPLKVFCGVLSDKITIVSEKVKMWVCNTISVGLAGILCGLIGVSPTPFLSVFCLIASTSIMGMNAGAFYKCGSLHSRQYGHFVLAMIQFSKCVALVIGPLMVAALAHSDEDAAGWRIIFIVNAVLMMIANIAFYFTATDKPAEFTKITRESMEKEKSDSEIDKVA